MLKEGHWGAALVCYAPVGWLLLGDRPGLAVVGGIVVLALARLPDVDLRVPLVPHRGPTHTLAFALLVGGVFAGVATLVSARLPASMAPPWLVPFTAFLGVFGIVTHLLGDVLTPSGVALFWPLSRRRFTVRLVRADDTLANWGLLALGTFATAMAVLLR